MKKPRKPPGAGDPGDIDVATIEGEPDGDDELGHPLVVAQIERALSPYRRLLPAEVLTGFGKALGIVLTSHPDVVGLVHRLHEVTSYEGDAPPAPRFFFDGDTLLWHHIQVALMERLREYTRSKGRMPVVPPEASESALYVCTMSFEDDPRGPDLEEVVRGRVEALCDAMTGAMFFGLVCHVEWAPEALAEWGETGRVLAVIQPEAKAALRRAAAAVPKPDAAVLDLYERHLGDMERVAGALRMNDEDAVAFVALAFERLGGELRTAALATARDRQGLH